MKNGTNKIIKKLVLQVILGVSLEFFLFSGIIYAQETNYNKTNGSQTYSFVERNNKGMNSNKFNTTSVFANYGYSAQYNSNMRLNLSGITENDNGLGEIAPVSDGIYILILLCMIYSMGRSRKILKKKNINI